MGSAGEGRGRDADPVPHRVERVFLGRFAHAPEIDRLEILDDAFVGVDAGGAIVALGAADDPAHAPVIDTARAAGTLVRTDGARFFLPGLVDLHVHAPQWPQLGKALHLPLRDWLHGATFPLERRYADVGFAHRVYRSLVSTLLSHGTTTAAYFATLHDESTRALADLCVELGQRALVGRVAMDDPAECPDDYRDASTDAALAGTEALIDHVRRIPGNGAGRVLPAITPRFVPSCTDALLEGLGALAARHGCHVQTHCSESDWEHGFVLERFGRADAEVLDGFGLLTRRSVLAHCTHARDADLARFARRGAGVAHCPLSNAWFSEGVFPLRRALGLGVRVGLGTDVSGGPDASLLSSCRHAMSASRLLGRGTDARVPAGARGTGEPGIDFVAALHLGTAGGADVLELPVGRFRVGDRFDAILIDPDAPGGGVVRFDDLDTDADVVQKCVHGATRANVVGTWTDGVKRCSG